MVYTPEGFTNDSPIYLITSTPDKKPRAQKSLCLVTNILDVKNKTATCRVGAAKSKLKVNKYDTTPWVLKKSEKEIKKLMNR